ncbi:egg cell-secreted protein 1.1 [Quercus suber]|uniref:Egg cell-secreted protein 1.1 n=1 Tax=Quercus suber TaxID=58331 RepID=A0AAW0M5K4_QUESU
MSNITHSSLHSNDPNRGPAPSPVGANQITVSKLYLLGKLPFLGLSDWNWEKDVAKCWSSLSSINRCVDEIYGTLSRGKFSLVNPGCCKSITVISHRCWPKMFPLNPLFPPLLRSKCARSASRATAKPWRI